MPYSSKFSYTDIHGIDVFLERFQTRLYVGRLEMLGSKFHFAYTDSYLKEKGAISLGPEFPLTQKEFQSPSLFNSLKDRIPDPENPAYESYCKAFGISPDTEDPLILLATIGRRGPSSFIFEPIFQQEYTFAEFDKFRKDLGLSLQDAALLFDVSVSVLQKIKAGGTSGKEILKRLELYYTSKEALSLQIETHGKFLHSDKLENVLKYLQKNKSGIA